VNRTDVHSQHRQLVEMHAVHRPVLVALTVLCASGVLLMAADFDTYIASPVMWIKLALVFLLLVNGVLLVRDETRARRTLAMTPKAEPSVEVWWHRVRAGAIRSVVLWTATLVAGAVLVGNA
jgi:hypothetical protein